MIAHIKNIETDEVRTHDVGDIPLDLVDFIFADGSYACDCNRANFFDGSDVECSSDKYEVNVEHEGQIIHREFDG